MYEFLESLVNQEKAIFCINVFRNNGKIMSLRIRRVCDVWKSPITIYDNTPHGCEKGNSDGSDTDYLESRNTNGEGNKQEKEAKSVDNQHPVEVCDKTNHLWGIGGILKVNGEEFGENARKYVYLPDVLGLFKNRKQTKTKVVQRRNIIEHLNRLKRYEVK